MDWILAAADISGSPWWLALITLTLLEIVLGIDNIVFISILVNKLPEAQRAKARFIGLALAMVMRVGLLFALGWIMSLTKDLFTLPVLDVGVSGRDLILIIGGLFLIGKSTREIHHAMEVHDEDMKPKVATTFFSAMLQIIVIDIIFSLDSVITAVGMVPADQMWVMITAVIIAVMFMMAFAAPVSNFIDRHPTVKMLALSFLILVGFTLVVDGLEIPINGEPLHIPKGYIYFAMAFSVCVEFVNIRIYSAKKKRLAKKAAKEA